MVKIKEVRKDYKLITNLKLGTNVPIPIYTVLEKLSVIFI